MRLREFASLLGPLHDGQGPDRLARCHNIEDLRAETRRFLPRAVFDFVDGGAEEETTLRRNRAGEFPSRGGNAGTMRVCGSFQPSSSRPLYSPSGCCGAITC